MLHVTAHAVGQYAQKLPEIQVKGKVVDASNEAIPYAAISFFPADSTTTLGTTSDLDGSFTQSLKPGKYRMTVTFLSFDDLSRILDLTANQTKVDLGLLRLQANAELLNEYEVVGEKSTVELQLDKRVFNVGKDLSNAGNTAAEVLANVPSVEVDAEGSVSLRGRENVRILIDGKPSALLGTNNSGLKMLQGSMIEKIEVITNPSARYEAQGETGIINIVLKKEQKKGVNGVFDVSAGYPLGAGATATINYRTGKMNMFASYGANYRESPSRGYSENEYNGPDTVFHYDNTSERLNKSFSNSGRVGSDFNLNDFNQLTISGSVRFNETKTPSSVTYRDLNPLSEIINTTIRSENERETATDMEGSLNYKKTFKQKDREWVTSLRYIDSKDGENANLNQRSSLASQADLVQQSTNVENENNVIFQTDYVHPLGKDAKFELGARGSNRHIENTFGVDINGAPLDDFTNSLTYTEMIGAAYGMYSGKLKRFTYQLGLRMEYTSIETELKKTNQKYPRTYLNPFPSAHVSYDLGNKNSLQLGYSRRINRPNFRELIPFFSYTDPRNYYSGNPNLNPEFSHSAEAGYLKTLKKGNLLANLYYRHTTNVVERIVVTDSAGLLQRFPINLSTEDAYGLEVSLNYELNSWWRFMANANVYRAMTSGAYQGRDYTSDTYTAQSRLTSNFKLPKDINLQLAANYRAPRNTTQGRRLAIYNMDVSLSKDILKGQGTLVLSSKDIFNTRKMRSITETEYLFATSMHQWQMRYTTLVFSYRLNQKKERMPRNSGPSHESDYEM